MKFFMLLGLCIIYKFSYSQNALRIEYRQELVDEEKIKAPFTIDGNIVYSNATQQKVRMFVNDSMAQIHFFRNDYDPIKKKVKHIGDKLIHHGYFYDFANKKYYSQCNLYKNLKYLVPIDTTEFKNWSLLSGEKSILGYTCKAALNINEKNDSTLVWFTNELKYKNGFLFYYGVPGIVLESYAQGNNSTVHWYAETIEETAIQLLRPKEGSIISKNEFYEVMKLRSEKMGGNSLIKIETTRTN